MKNRFIAALSAWLLALAPMVAAAAPAVEPVTYSLIRNGSASGQTVGITGGSYVLDISGTFGGSTLALSVTTNGITSEYDTWTSAPGSRPCFNIPTGSVVQATLTGGTPSGMTVTLGGVGSGGCATGSSGGGGAVTIADGDDEALGAKADSSCGTDTGTCTLIALVKRWLATATTLSGKIDTLNTNVTSAVPAGTNTIGATAGESATGSAVPAKASYAGANSGGNLVGVIQADSSAKIDISTATTTQLVALSSGKKIYITNYKVIAGGTGNFKFVYGTGTNCGTGTTDLEGANNLTAQAGSVAGSGLGPVLVVPASNALCATTSAAVQMSGHVAYTQF